VLAALALLGIDATKARAQGPQEGDAGKLRVVKFLYDAQPVPQNVVIFKYPATSGAPADVDYVKRIVGLPGETIVIKDGALFKIPSPMIERITIEGGKIEITGDIINIDGGKVEIIRQPRP